MARYALGQHEFIHIVGPPEYPQPVIDIETRAGSDGNTLWHMGTRGLPFQIATLADASSAAHAAALVRIYRRLQGGPLVDMRWADFDVVSVQYAVIKVDPIDVSGILLGLGGVNVPVAGGVCRAAWTLVPFGDP